MRRIRKIETPVIKFPNNIDNIDIIYYINLEKRKDRNIEVLEQIKKIDPELNKTQRINAVEDENGALGCGLSHIKALDDAIENNYNNIIILEDDFNFNDSKVLKKLNWFLKNYNNYNICLLSGNIIKCKNKGLVSDCINVQTTSAYMINSRFFSILKDNYKEAVEKLSLGEQTKYYAIDINWKKLQGNDKEFYIFTPKLGYQRQSYSNIEKRITNYGV